MARLSTDEHRQVTYALRTYGGPAGQRLAAELDDALSADRVGGQQEQADPNAGQQENQQDS